MSQTALHSLKLSESDELIWHTVHTFNFPWWKLHRLLHHWWCTLLRIRSIILEGFLFFFFSFLGINIFQKSVSMPKAIRKTKQNKRKFWDKKARKQILWGLLTANLPYFKLLYKHVHTHTREHGCVKHTQTHMNTRLYNTWNGITW